MFSKHVAKTVGVGSSPPAITPPTAVLFPSSTPPSLEFCTDKDRRQRAGAEALCTFVLSMNCEWANKFFQPLSLAFTDIPHRLHTQITAQWRPPGGPGRHRGPTTPWRSTQNQAADKTWPNWGVGVRLHRQSQMLGNGVFKQDAEGVKQNKAKLERENRIIAGVWKGMWWQIKKEGLRVGELKELVWRMRWRGACT